MKRAEVLSREQKEGQSEQLRRADLINLLAQEFGQQETGGLDMIFGSVNNLLKTGFDTPILSRQTPSLSI
nr:hypothetical protein [uncultured Cohaesibacter sp.]